MMLYDKALVTELIFYAPFELNFSYLSLETSIINQSAAHNHVTIHIFLIFFCVIVPTSFLGK